jgi:hypothetical protein
VEAPEAVRDGVEVRAHVVVVQCALEQRTDVDGEVAVPATEQEGRPEPVPPVAVHGDGDLHVVEERPQLR